MGATFYLAHSFEKLISYLLTMEYLHRHLRCISFAKVESKQLEGMQYIIPANCNVILHAI